MTVIVRTLTFTYVTQKYMSPSVAPNNSTRAVNPGDSENLSSSQVSAGTGRAEAFNVFATSRLEARAATPEVPQVRQDAMRQALLLLAPEANRIAPALAGNPQGVRGVQGLAELVVAQAELTANNHGKQLDQVTNEEWLRAKRVIVSQIERPTIGLRDGPIAYDQSLTLANPKEVADAIIDSVTHLGAKQTLLNFRNSFDGDDKGFVDAVRPALTRGEKFAWSTSELRSNAEKLQQKLVNDLLRNGTIPPEYRYRSDNPNDHHAMGLDYDRLKAESAQAFGAAVRAEEAAQQAKVRERILGYRNDARSEADWLRTKKAFEAAVRNSSTAPEVQGYMNEALEIERARAPKLEPVSTYRESTATTPTPSDINSAQKFAPEVSTAMQNNAPGTYERNRPVEPREIEALRARIEVLAPAIERGLERADTLAQTLESQARVLRSSGQETNRTLLDQDRARVAEYQRVCGYLDSQIEESRELCDKLENMDPTDPDYSSLLGEFKAVQRDLLQAGGANELRVKLGRELVVIEGGYSTDPSATDPSANRAVDLSTLSAANRQKQLTRLESTLMAQLAGNQDISPVIEAIRALDPNPKRLVSFLYRLERSNSSGLVEKFASDLSHHPEVREGILQTIKDADQKLTTEQRKTVESLRAKIENATPPVT